MKEGDLYMGAYKKDKEFMNYFYISGIPGKFKAKSSAEILVDLTLKKINKIKNKKQ